MRGWRRVILLLAAPANPWFPGATAFNALSRWESRLILAQLQLVAVATDLLPSSPQGVTQATRVEAPSDRD